MNTLEESEVLVLESHNHHWVTLRDAGYIKNLDHVTFKELEAIYKKNVTTYPVNQFCPACVANMVKELYSWYEAQTPVKEAEQVQPLAPEPEVKRSSKPRRKQ